MEAMTTDDGMDDNDYSVDMDDNDAWYDDAMTEDGADNHETPMEATPTEATPAVTNAANVAINNTCYNDATTNDSVPDYNGESMYDDDYNTWDGDNHYYQNVADGHFDVLNASDATISHFQQFDFASDYLGFTLGGDMLLVDDEASDLWAAVFWRDDSDLRESVLK